MKKLLLIFSLLILASVAMFADTTKPTQPEGWTDGSGGIINNLAELRWLSETPEAWDEDWKLGADIDAAETSEWYDTFVPIGEGEINQFTGTFDGQGFTISNLYSHPKSIEHNIGFFGAVKGATIENLNLVNFSYIGKNQVGGLIAYASESNINNCHVEGRLDASSKVGGLIGYLMNNSVVTNSSANVVISCTGDCGGLISFMYESRISDCYSNSEISNESTNSFSGGFAGYIVDCRINKCYSTGDVHGYKYVGGFASYIYRTTIKNSYTKSNVIRTDSTLEKFSAFAVRVGLSTTIENCYSIGSVIFEDNSSPTDAGFIGNLLDGCIIKDNFFDSEASNQDSAYGATAKSTAEMKTKATFTDAGWDFENIWDIDENINNGYPHLRIDFETKPLLVQEFSPADGELEVQIDAPLKLNFNSDVHIGKGSIALYKSTTELIELFDVTEDISISGKTVEFLPSNPLEQLTHYYIIISDSCFHDEANTYFAGIYDSTTWNFRTMLTDTVTSTPPASWSDGSGGIIYNLAELRWLSETTEAWDEDWKLGADIDAWESNYWVHGSGMMPIGYPRKEVLFTGTFDGQGYTISNIKIGEFGMEGYTLLHAGLFGKISGATVENINITNCDVQANNNAGGLTGAAENSTIRNCNVSGFVFAYNVSGGIVSSCSNTIIDSCSTSGEVVAAKNVGGVVGELKDSSEVRFCHSDANVNPYMGTSGSYMGGCIGSMFNSSVYNCSATGDVSANVIAGGFVGRAEDNAYIEKCYSTGNVSGNKQVGGFAGSIEDSKISISYSKGNASALDEVGGFICDNEYSLISNCFSMGDAIQDSTSLLLAAFCSYNYHSTIKNCYSTGSAYFFEDFENLVNMGFITINLSGTTLNNFFDSEASNQETAIGATAKTTAEMKTITTFTDVGWDFENIWYIDPEINDGYPFFIEGASAVEELPIIGSNLYCYPNLVSNGDIININMKDKNFDTTFYIYDMRGRLIEEIHSNQIHIDDKYFPGMYFIKVDMDYCKFIVE